MVRLGPDNIDVQLFGVIQDAWGGQNESKLPWDKVPFACKISRCGMQVDNIVSIQKSREALRMRRLIGSPFSRKFLLDQEIIFKRCITRAIQNIDQLRVHNKGAVEVSKEFRKYALDVVSIAS